MISNKESFFLELCRACLEGRDVNMELMDGGRNFFIYGLGVVSVTDFGFDESGEIEFYLHDQHIVYKEHQFDNYKNKPAKEVLERVILEEAMLNPESNDRCAVGMDSYYDICMVTRTKIYKVYWYCGYRTITLRFTDV